VSKKYIDADIILRSAELTAELTEEDIYYKKLMEEIPKHDKKEENLMDNVIYRKGNFLILEVHDGNRKGFIIYNTKKPFKDGHTHLKSLDMAKVIINNVMNNKIPKSHNEYIITSHIRVATDKKYISSLEQLIETRKQKGKQDYRNSNSKKVKK